MTIGRVERGDRDFGGFVGRYRFQIDESGEIGFAVVWVLSVLVVVGLSLVYVSNGDDSNKLQLPRYKGVREDKSVNECINPEL